MAFARADYPSQRPPCRVREAGGRRGELRRGAPGRGRQSMPCSVWADVRGARYPPPPLLYLNASPQPPGAAGRCRRAMAQQTQPLQGTGAVALQRGLRSHSRGNRREPSPVGLGANQIENPAPNETRHALPNQRSPREAVGVLEGGGDSASGRDAISRVCAPPGAGLRRSRRGCGQLLSPLPRPGREAPRSRERVCSAAARV